MSKYNVRVTDINFQNLFNEFCEENKSACIDFLKGKDEFVSTIVDRTPYFDSLLSTKRVFFQSAIYQEFNALNNQDIKFDDFLSNKIDELSKTKNIHEILDNKLYQKGESLGIINHGTSFTSESFRSSVDKFLNNSKEHLNENNNSSDNKPKPTN